jgi:NAD-dependent dihydropyrimidine dehydrogenase PreA subunit
MKRNIIKIDEEKCTGCGLCIVNCAEGSLAIIDGKARLVREALCDGLGACLGHCPEGALTIEVRDAEEFDEHVVEQHLKELKAREAKSSPCGCPSAATVKFDVAEAPASGGSTPSQLGHWPVQLTLLNPSAPFLKGADLLLAADCGPFAYPDFHRDFLKGRVVAVACPKLDDADAHMKKLADVIRYGEVARLTIARMDVPCCGGLSMIARRAVEESGRKIPVREIIIGRDGTIVSDKS